MKIFLSWSGPQSRIIAEALNDWLRHIVQAVKPFYSPEIEKGAKWSNEIDAALEGTNFGIICLTPDNIQSPWIHFEAGALSKTSSALIWTFLFGLTPADVPPPLGRFQHTTTDQKDVLALLKTINQRLPDAGGESIPERLLEENFNVFWPMLDQKLKAITSQAPESLPASPNADRPRSQREDRAVLDEILELVRNQERRLLDIELRGRLNPPIMSQLPPWNVAWLAVPLTGSDENRDLVRELAETLRNMLPSATIRLTIEKSAAEIRIQFKEALHEDEIRILIELAANTIGIPQPRLTLGRTF